MEYKNKEWLYINYITNNFSQSKIAKKCGVATETIAKYTRKFGFKKTKEQIYKLGKDSLCWKGGRSLNKNGYIYVYVSKERNAVAEHRYVMEQKIGRKLLTSERVHHINGIRDDNREENLVLCKNDKEHRKYHKKVDKVKKVCYNGCVQ